MSDQKKKKHHYVNAGYLRLFSMPDKTSAYSSFVWMYKKDVAIRTASRKSVRSICHREGYYAQIKNDESVDYNILEDGFSEIEDQVIKLIRSLNSDTPELKISSENKGLLAFYIGLMFSRGPSFRDGIKQAHELIIKKLLSTYAKNNPPPFSYSGNIVDIVDIGVLEQVSLHPMINLASQVAEAILQKYWQFQRPCDNVNFITSDTPVVMASSLGHVGPCHPLTEFIFPLRKDLCLVCTHRNPDVNTNNLIFTVSSEEVLKFNEAIVQAASSEIYACENLEQISVLAAMYYGVSQRLRVD
ncbi:MAG: hypothetical protein A3E85_03095 [Gammaproteobacteria bacterium RIFCSPHIGHO2_12_FULL_45_12]|nr:MAG: hypothetical protein A3E85_03095 [Gammaproteobacteria bacterium RIFCSPHIGHO2_12_FULL_45_12]